LPDGLKYARMLRHEPRLFFTIVRTPEAQLMSLLWHMIANKRGLVEGRDHPSAKVEAYFSSYVEVAESFEYCSDGAQSGFFCRAHCSVFKGGRSAADLSGECAYVREAYLDGVHIVGLSDRLLDSLRLVAWAMKWPAPRNLGHARMSGAGNHEVPEKVREILWRRLALDSALYEGARERFERDYARLCRAAGSPDMIDDFLDLEAVLAIPSCAPRH
jgi:hypothetical protein